MEPDEITGDRVGLSRPQPGQPAARNGGLTLPNCLVSIMQRCGWTPYSPRTRRTMARASAASRVISANWPPAINLPSTIQVPPQAWTAGNAR